MTRKSSFQKGWSLSCPRCGEGRLYDGLLSVAKGCHACGLSYDFADSGDGPAVLVWTSVTALSAIYALRKGKAILIANQYANDAQEGRQE